MNSEKLLSNDDAVSVSIGFILMFGVTVIVFSAIILSFYALSQQSEKSAMLETFRITGSGLAARITTVDTLVNITGSYGGTINDLEYSFSLPASVAGKSYMINIANSTPQIILEADNGARIAVPYNVSVDFTGMIIYSGAEDYKLKYDRAGSRIYIEE